MRGMRCQSIFRLEQPISELIQSERHERMRTSIEQRLQDRAVRPSPTQQQRQHLRGLRRALDANCLLSTFR